MPRPSAATSSNSLLNLLDSGLSSSTALILPKPLNQHVTYSQLKSHVLLFRDVLRKELGVRTGDVVAMSFVNGFEFVVGFLATGLAKAISAPLNPAYSTSEVEFYLGDTKPVLLLLPKLSSLDPSGPQHKGAYAALEAAKKSNICTVEFCIGNGRPEIRTIFPGSRTSPLSNDGNDADPKSSDVALVLHTSGTTSRPKSVPLTHHNLITTTENIVKTYSLTPADRSYLVMPLFHVHGLLAGLLAPFRAGASAVVPERFSANRFWDDFSEHKCTYYTAVPTIHAILVDSPIPKVIPPIRFIRSCSSSLPPVLLERVEATFKAPMLEAYAMTEAAHQMTSNLAGERVPGSVGVGIGVDISVRDDKGREVRQGERGEVCVRGENVTLGYWNNEKANKEAFLEDGWFRTGDQGLILPSGHLKLTGRLKELINRGGEKISPLEIDAAILRVDGVSEAVCFGVEDTKYGEVVWAGVVLKKGQPAGAEELIKRALDGQIAKFKIPERIIVTDAIPKTATGKIQRRHVKEAFVKLSHEQEAKPKAKL